MVAAEDHDKTSSTNFPFGPERYQGNVTISGVKKKCIDFHYIVAQDLNPHGQFQETAAEKRSKFKP